MGRFIKTVLGYDGIDKRKYGYYSTPDFIAKFITDELININPNGKKVLDPAVGNEELLAHFFQAGKQIDSLDIRDFGNYRYSRFQQINFIDFFKKNTTALDYDYYIANPPYNCHEVNYIRDNKDELKTIFADV
jgi:type I restriction-modification system DNA methylase subunit